MQLGALNWERRESEEGGGRRVLGSCEVGWRQGHSALVAGSQEDWWLLHLHSGMGDTEGWGLGGSGAPG